MKRVLLIIAAICALTACKKTVISPGLFGKWELRSEVGGIAGMDSTFAAGNGRVYVFNSDSTYKQLYKGTLLSQGTFHIETLYPPSGPYEEILFNGNTSGQLFVLKGTQLSIGEDADDGIVTSFQKISD